MDVNHERFVAAANANQYVQQYRQDCEWWSSCWREESIAEKPPIRVEFEHAIVFASFSEALSMRRGKSGWGALVRIEPLHPDDFLHPCRIVYVLKASSTMRQRWEFRDTFKNILGKHRGLVTEAVRLNKKEFLLCLSPDHRRVIRSKLELEPEDFWRAVRRGERFGADGIHKFVKRLKERTDGYEFDFAPKA